MRGRRMSRRSNRSNFKRGTRVKGANMGARPMRGGFRL